jgi:hypothetical protein
MLHKQFPWVHVVRGRPRHPASQGSVKRSHGPFKASLLAKLKEKNTDDWVSNIHIVQCEVNNHPIRSRGDISPYCMYFSRTNKSSYSTTLGKAYKTAKTEYGLRLAKLVLDKISDLDRHRVLQTDEVEFIIKAGDDLFLRNCEEPVSESIASLAKSVLRHFQYDTEDIVFTEELDDTSVDSPNDNKQEPQHHDIHEEQESDDVKQQPQEDAKMDDEAKEEDADQQQPHDDAKLDDDKKDDEEDVDLDEETNDDRTWTMSQRTTRRTPTWTMRQRTTRRTSTWTMSQGMTVTTTLRSCHIKMDTWTMSQRMTRTTTLRSCPSKTEKTEYMDRKVGLCLPSRHSRR